MFVINEWQKQNPSRTTLKVIEKNDVLSGHKRTHTSLSDADRQAQTIS